MLLERLQKFGTNDKRVFLDSKYLYEAIVTIWLIDEPHANIHIIWTD